MASAAQAAKHIFMSERNFMALLDSGAQTRAPRGEYNLDKVRKERLKYLEAKKAADEGGGTSSLSKARERVANARAESAEFELEAQVGKWIEVEEATKGVIAEIILIRENALTCAGKISDSLHQVDREQAYDIVDTEIRECLGRLGGGKGGVEFAIEVIEHSGGKKTWVLELLNQLLEYYEEAEQRDKVAKEKRDKGDSHV